MQKTAKKKDIKGTVAAYEAALGTLDQYLELVELPPAAEIWSRHTDIGRIETWREPDSWPWSKTSQNGA